MYEKLIDLLKKEVQTDSYNKELLPFWLENLEQSRNLETEKKDIILRANEVYIKLKKSKHTTHLALLGLISFLNKRDNYKDYTLKSLCVLGFYLSDYDAKELEDFFNLKVSPHIINEVASRKDNLWDKCSYLDSYQENMINKEDVYETRRI